MRHTVLTRQANQLPETKTMPTTYKLTSIQHKDSVYFRPYPTHIEHWGPKIDGVAHDTIKQGLATYRRYVKMGYKLANVV